MEIQNMPEEEAVPRYVKRALAGAVAKATAPVVVLEGAHGAGKTAFAKNEEALKGYRYVTLADEETFAQASAHPADWLALLRRPAIIDDAHRIPGLLEAAQRVAPQRKVKRPAFLLIASERLRAVEDGAAQADAAEKKGKAAPKPKPPPRVERFTLYPLTQAEICRRPGCIIDDLFDGDIMTRFCSTHTRSDLRTMMRIGGFPARVLRPAHALSATNADARPLALDLCSVPEEPIGDSADIDQLIRRAILEKMMTTPGLSLGVDAMATACSVDAPTLTAFLEGLRSRFLLHKLTMLDKKKPQQVSFSKTRIYPVDTVAAIEALQQTGHDLTTEPPVFAKVLRTLCFAQLIPALQWASEPTECFHWKKFERRMREVDLVLKRGNRLVGFAIRNSRAARHDTIGALRLLAEDERFDRGFILYMGLTPRRLSEKIWALPVSALWEAEAFLPGLSSFGT